METDKLKQFIREKMYSVYNLPQSIEGTESTRLLEELISSAERQLDVPQSLPCTCNKVSCDCPRHSPLTNLK